jgi:hypothetical protein
MEDAMRKLTMLAALLGFVALTAPAVADDHAKGQFHFTSTPLTLGAMRQKIDALGYDVHRLKAKHGRFEVVIVDRQSGGAVMAVFSAQTGDLIRAKPAS